MADTINVVDLNSFGQSKSRFYASRTVANEVTFNFREFQHLPILNILNYWTKKCSPIKIF